MELFFVEKPHAAAPVGQGKLRLGSLTARQPLLTVLDEWLVLRPEFLRLAEWPPDIPDSHPAEMPVGQWIIRGDAERGLK